MSVLVTGGAGYIGSVAVEFLHQQGEDVIVLDDLSNGHRDAIDPAIPFYEGSVGDSELVQRIALERQLESCVHFAASADAGESLREPAKYYENNVEQGNRLLRTLVNIGVRRLVFSSTCAVHGEPESVPITESDRQWPVNPYGWSKLMIERMLESYDAACGLEHVALRYFNAAGATRRCGEAHDPETHLIPNALYAAQGRLPKLFVFGDDYPTPDGTAIRDYVHVADLARAHLLALNYLRAGGESTQLNLGTGHGHSVLDVLKAAESVTGRIIPYEVRSARAGDASHLVADACKARSVLDWQAQYTDLSEIVATAWDWMAQHPNGYVNHQTRSAL